MWSKIMLLCITPTACNSFFYLYTSIFKSGWCKAESEICRWLWRIRKCVVPLGGGYKCMFSMIKLMSAFSRNIAAGISGQGALLGISNIKWIGMLHMFCRWSEQQYAPNSLLVILILWIMCETWALFCSIHCSTHQPPTNTERKLNYNHCNRRKIGWPDYSLKL